MRNCNVIGLRHGFAGVGSFDCIYLAGVFYAQITTRGKPVAVSGEIVVGKKPRGSYTVNLGDAIAVVGSCDSVLFARAGRWCRGRSRWSVKCEKEILSGGEEAILLRPGQG